MRNAFLFILFCASGFSCNKDQRLEDFKNQIVGKWEIEKWVCVECLNPLTNYPAGNGNIMVLLKDGTFERRLHDSVIFKGKFFLTKSSECGKPDSDFAFSTNERSAATVIFIRIQAGNLLLTTPSCYTDGATTIYRRIE